MTQHATVLEASPKTLPSGFVYVHQIHPDIRVSPRYQMADNFIGRRFVHYFDDVLLISREAAEALYKVQERVAKDGFDLVIYDAYRPQTTVNSFTDWANDLGDSTGQENYYPRVNKADVFELGYIARRSGHTRGSTVDLTLIEKGKSLKPTVKLKRTLTDGFSFDYLDDGTVDTFTHFDLFDDASHHDTHLIPEEYKKWRNYLRDVMKEASFRPYSKEWWHYTLDNEPYSDTYFDFSVKNYDK